MTYFDAHNHVHDTRLASHRNAFIPELDRLPLGNAVANGTREQDWNDVQNFSLEHRWIIPSYGLHPWYAPERSPGWLEDLRARLEAEERAAVGEVGLDRWVQGYDLEVQRPVFIDQIRLARELHRPVSIHCIRAWGSLADVLKVEKMPARGFLLHAYGGPVEMVDAFVEYGAYFSFSPYFLHERKAAQREVFARIPRERLLVETDAPDLRPPDESNPRPITAADGTPANHPANIDVAYRGLAAVREMDVSELSLIIEENFRRLFGP